MEQKEKIKRIKKMVNSWNEVRWNHKKALRLLNSGAFFTIEREFYSLWSADNPTAIYAYFGVRDEKLYFIITDENTFKIPWNERTTDDLKKIFIQEFNNDMELLDYDFIKNAGSSSSITKEEALARVLRWQMMKETWIINQIQCPDYDPQGIGIVFYIPFNGLQSIFDSKTVKNIAAVMGLKYNDNSGIEKVVGSSTYLLDLTLWGIEEEADTNVTLKSAKAAAVPVEDLSAICPPYPG